MLVEQSIASISEVDLNAPGSVSGDTLSQSTTQSSIPYNAWSSRNYGGALTSAPWDKCTAESVEHATAPEPIDNSVSCTDCLRRQASRGGAHG